MNAATPTKPSVLLVCLGNICRSPLAEGAFRAAAQKAGLDVHCDSCGTAAYHIGDAPDPRSIETAAHHDVDITQLQARQLCADDFTQFTQIFAMDHQNLANIRAAAPSNTSAKIALLMDAVPGREGAAIADPYYHGEDQFEETWQDVWAAACAFTQQLS